MGRQFAAASSQLCSVTSVPLTNTPLTLACWFYCFSIPSADQTLIDIGAFAAGNQKWRLVASGTGGATPNSVYAHCSNATGTFAVSTAAYTAGQWYHMAAVFSSSTSRAAYLNGANKGTDATSKAPTTPDTLAIGATGGGSSTWTQFANGIIADVGIWTIDLSDQEIAQLASGMSPSEIRRRNLFGYYYPDLAKYGSSDYDFSRGGRNLVGTNSPTWGPHPPQAQTRPWVVDYGRNSHHDHCMAFQYSPYTNSSALELTSTPTRIIVE